MILMRFGDVCIGIYYNNIYIGGIFIGVDCYFYVFFFWSEFESVGEQIMVDVFQFKSICGV